MVFLHIIFGMFAFIGALGLGVAFRDSFTELSTPKKAADYFILRRCDWFNSPRVHISNKKSICFSRNSCLSCRLFYCSFQKKQ